jgi:hypothetical protein
VAHATVMPANAQDVVNAGVGYGMASNRRRLRLERPPVTFARRSAIAALAILVLAVAAWFRIAGTLHDPLWLDEAYSAYAAGKGFGFLWHVVPLYETHPPFYYSLLRLWTLVFGDSLGALRSLGIVCGLLTLPVAALAAREAARLARLPVVPVTATAFLLAALFPVLVEMTREVRPYPVLILVYAVALWALIRAGRLTAAREAIPGAPFLLYCAFLAAVLWLHNLGPLYAAALGLAALALIARRGLARRDWVLFVGGHALVALVYLPAFLILLDQAPTWVKSTWLHFTFAGMPSKLAELFAAQGLLAIAPAALLIILAIVRLAQSTDARRLAVALVAAALLPVAASITLSLLVSPVFIIRTMSAVAVPSLLLLAIGVGGHMPARGVLRWAGLIALLPLAVQMTLIDRHRRNGGPTQDWYASVRWLQERYHPGDVVWAYPNEGALPFDYAVRDLGLSIATRPIPTPVPTLDGGPGSWYPTGSRGVVSLSADRLKALADAPEARRVPTVWLLRLGAAAYDEDDHLLRALQASRVRVADCESYPIDIVGLALPEVAGRPVAPFVALPEDRPRCLPGGGKPPRRTKPSVRDRTDDRFPPKPAKVSGRRVGPTGGAAAH